jgi:hypothetical protein
MVMTVRKNAYGIEWDDKHLYYTRYTTQTGEVIFWDITAAGLVDAARPYLVSMMSHVVRHEDIGNDVTASVECEVVLEGLPPELVSGGEIIVRAVGEEHERRRGADKLDTRRFVVRNAETAARKRALKLALGFTEYDFNKDAKRPTEEEEGTPIVEESDDKMWKPRVTKPPISDDDLMELLSHFE